MTIRAALPSDAARLTAIAFAAKRHWGYPETWIDRWKSELTITAEYLATVAAFVASSDANDVGFCAVRLELDTAVLDHLWVIPSAMKRGIGRALFERAEAWAGGNGRGMLTVVGDPHAEGFYRRMGAEACDRHPAPMDGQERWLPVFRKQVPAVKTTS